MVPPTGCIFSAPLDHCPCFVALRQLHQRRTLTSPPRVRRPNSLLPSRRHNRTHYASLHASDVHHRTRQDSPTVIRNVLVHASPIHSLSSWHVHSCHRLLRTRLGTSFFSFRRQTLLATLHRLRRMAMGAFCWRLISVRASLP